MTAIPHAALDAAAFLTYRQRYVPLDHPNMASANRTLRAAGVWSQGEVHTERHAEHHVEVLLVGTFCAGDRHRVVYSILADGIEIGTAMHWTSKTVWPWGLTLPAGRIVNLGFRNKGDLVASVQRFVRTGEVA